MNKTALLVTDSERTRESLMGPLQLANYVVFDAGHARDALHHLAAARVDVVLLDLDRPTANGWDAFELLDEIVGERPCLPVILITGDAGLSQQAQAYGARALAEKPLNVPALVAVAAELLAESPPERQERVCNHHRADFRHLPPELDDFREAIYLRATTPYLVSFPTSRWGINE